MSTDFNTSFGNDDIIEAEHVKQFAKPINDLESGAAFFREATNTNEVYEVDFSESAIPGGTPGHVLESLEPGQMIVFKANTDSQDDAELEVTLEGVSPESYPLFAGDTQVSQGQIKENQIVVAIFNDEGGGRFDVVGVSTGSGGGGGAESLDDLDDVSIDTPTEGQVLRYDGTAEEFVNEDLVIADVGGLQTALDSKQDELTEPDDVPGLTSALAAKQDTSEKGQANGYASLDGSGLVPTSQLPDLGAAALDDLSDVSIDTPAEGQVLRYDGTAEEFVNEDLAIADVSGLQSALNAKQDELTELDDVPGLTSALAAKQDTSEKGQANGYASLDGSGLVPVAQLPDLGAGSLDDLSDVSIDTPAEGQVLRYDGTAEEFVNADMAIADVSGLQSALNAKQDELTGVGDVPGLQTALNSKQDELTEPGDVPGLTSALVAKQDTSEKGQANGYASLDSSGLVPASQLPTGGGGASELDELNDVSVSNYTSGRVLRANGSQFVDAQLDVSDTTGTLPINRGGTNATTASSARSNLGANNASNLTTGTLPLARVPNLPASQITSGTFATARIPSLPASQITSGTFATARIPGLPASQITSGTLPAARGGTGITGFGGTNRIMYSSSSTALTHSGSLTFNGTFLSTPQITVPSMSNLSGGHTVYRMSANGNLVWLSSRAKHKTEVVPIGTSIEDLMSWRAVEFTWKPAFGGQRDLGLIADEVDALYPLAALREPDWQYLNEETGEYATDENGRPIETDEIVPTGVKYDRAWIPMLAAVQDFYKKFQALEEKIESRLAALEGAS